MANKKANNTVGKPEYNQNVKGAGQTAGQTAGRSIEKEIIVKSGAQTINHDLIAQRAWEIWKQEGGYAGNELKHWFQAEQELTGKR